MDNTKGEVMEDSQVLEWLCYLLEPRTLELGTIFFFFFTVDRGLAFHFGCGKFRVHFRKPSNVQGHNFS